MIILNQSKTKNTIKIVDINDTISTNEYYKKLWKSKYNVDLIKKTTFSKNLVNYLKGETSYIK